MAASVKQLETERRVNIMGKIQVGDAIRYKLYVTLDGIHKHQLVEWFIPCLNLYMNHTEMFIGGGEKPCRFIRNHKAEYVDTVTISPDVWQKIEEYLQVYKEYLKIKPTMDQYKKDIGKALGIG